MSEQHIPEFINGQLWYTHGEAAGTVADYLHARTDIAQPLYWLEPALQLNADGSAGRLKNFAPFTETLPAQLPALEAAYLFGLHSGLPHGLHIIATGNSCRWLEFGTWQREGSTCLTISERNYAVLTRRDFERFFGEGQVPAWRLKDQLYVTEYWHGAGLFTWWLGKEHYQNGEGK